MQEHTSDSGKEAEQTQLPISFEAFLLKALAQKRELIGKDERVNGLLQLLLEYRENARALHDYATLDRITSALRELGLQLQEEVQISVRRAADEEQ